MSHLKSSKTDEQELMWKKLSTPVVTFVFHDIGRRGEIKPGELNVIAAYRNVGKSMYYDLEATHEIQ